MPDIWLILEIVLVGYIVWDGMHAVLRYRELKRGIANGEADARPRMYQEILVFEWLSTALAIGAVGFRWNMLTPRHLGLADGVLARWLPSPDMLRGELSGMFAVLVVGIGVWVAWKLLRKDSGEAPAAAVSEGRALRGLPDFSALLPITVRERWMFLAVAISAGVCEELVFRGWLLSALHDQLGVNGVWLLVLAAAIFGLAHAYQGVVGVLLTGYLGAVFCVVYVATGSLLVPMILHVIIDARLALLPATSARKRPLVPA